MKEIAKLGLILFIITAIAGMILGFANEVTKEPIAAQEAKARTEAMQQTLPSAKEFKMVEVNLPEGSNIQEINAGYDGDTLVGFAVKVAPKGYAGPIEIMVGISNDSVIQGIKILKHGETPGLGANAENADFSDQFKEKSGEITVVKGTAANDNEISAITGATITSRGVTNGVNEVVELLNKRDASDSSGVKFQF